MIAQSVFFAFPGQGSQCIGMGKSFFDNFTKAREVFLEADEALKFPLSKLMFSEEKSDEQELSKTENAQPALFITSMAILAVLLDEIGKPIEELCAYTIGHSLGEYSALCASGAISLIDGVKILRKRGEFMRDAFPTGGAMAAIIGLKSQDLEKLIQCSREGGEHLVIANDNSDLQVVLSGNEKSVQNAIKNAKDFKAMRAIQLQVSGPFHSPLMVSAEEKLKMELENLTITKPRVSVVANVSAAPTNDIEEIRTLLAKQITCKVRFTESIKLLDSKDISSMIEIGSKNVLCGLVRRIASRIATKPVNFSDDLVSVKEGYLNQ